MADYTLLDPVRAANGSRDAEALLRQPTHILLGVSEQAAAVLAQIDVATVFDLAISELFSHARNITLLAEDGDGNFATFGRVPRDAIRDGAHDLSLAELVAGPISRLASSFSVAKLDELAAALDLGSIHDLAAWPPYQAACDLLNRVYNPTPTYATGELDQGTPLDLLPATGQYPTERVQYEVLLFDSFVDDGGPPARPLVKAGQLDVSKLGTSPEGFGRPAIGGVLTYTQSWFTKGLSLGHLIHGVALGPGETTRIAVIDWARQVRTAAVESIEELELLAAELSRSRSIGEITSAVARETQKGRSAAQSGASAMQFGESRSGANLRDFNPFENPTAFTGLSVISPGVSVSGSSLGLSANASDASSWSTTSGRRDVGASLAQDIVDRTHQEAHSARNRRASIVREVSQTEAETVSTRTLTNYNHMHALTIEYYEVVQLYRTVVELAKAERCVFVPMKLLDFRDLKVIDRYRVALLAASLSPVMSEALSLPASTTPLRAPAVTSAELQAGDLGADAAGLADDKWLARDISGAFAATGGQIRSLADGRLALPSDAVVYGVDLTLAAPRPAGGGTAGGTTDDGFFVGSKIVQVSGSAQNQTHLRIKKDSVVKVRASGEVTFKKEEDPDTGFFVGQAPRQSVLGASYPTNTGLRIERGSRVTLRGVAGSIRFDPADSKSWNPDGDAGPGGAGWEAPNLRAGSLIARIGSPTNARSYQGGMTSQTSPTFTALEQGILYLLPNDKEGGMSGNSGSWDVDVLVEAPPGTATTDTFGADGMPVGAGTGFPARDLRRFSLICRVGTSAWAQGGVDTEFIASEDGELLLQPNDKTVDLEDNEGGWEVTLDVTLPVADTPTAAAEPSLTITKRQGAPVTVTRAADGQWPADNIRLRLEEIESLALTTPGARTNDVGFLAVTFSFRSKDFRIVVPVRLRASGAATVFHADVPADLVSHLLDHRLYYSQAVWRSLDPATIGVLLSGYTWRLDGQSRRLVEIVDPTPVAVIANYLALRLSGDVAAEYNAWIERAKIKVGSTREDQVPIPTGGVFAEAVLGRANSAEKLDITRFWDWQESPIPFEAPEIAAIQTGSRRDVDTTVPGQLGQPVLNIVNPPGLPDPQGMGAILAAIQNGNMFRDMSGLAGTIGLAQAAMTDAGRAATEAAKQAGADAATAAQLGAKVAEIAGQIVSAYLTKGGSLLGGVGGGGGSKQGLIQSPGGNSKTGSMLNYGKEMDQRGVPPAGGTGLPRSLGSNGMAPGGGTTTPGGGGTTPGGTGTTWPQNMALAPSWERDAMNAALGNPDQGVILASGRDWLANPIALVRGQAAKERASQMLLSAVERRWPEGQQIVPGTVFYGNTLIVDADTVTVYYVQDDVLYAMGRDAFLRDGLITAAALAAANAEVLATIANVEVAFIAGIFAAIPLWEGAGLVAIFLSGPAALLAANFVHLGLRARANRDALAEGRSAFHDYLDARACLQQEAPQLIDDLEKTVAWEAVKSLPKQMTAEQIAFYIGRLIRGFGIDASTAELTFGAVAKTLGLTSVALLVVIDPILNSPAAVEQAIKEQSQELAHDLAQNHVTVGTQQTDAWLRLLLENEQAQKCLQDMKVAADKVLHMLQLLNPRLAG
jgi:hypothetical protein